MDENDFDPLSAALSREHLQAIGYVTAAYSVLETEMDETIHFFLNVSHRIGSAVTAQLNFTSRLNVVRALADELLKEGIQKDQLDAITKRIEDMQGCRNDIIHAKWRPMTEDGISLAEKITARKKINSSISRRTAADILKVAEQIDFVMRDLSLWITNQVINRTFSHVKSRHQP